MAELIEFPEPKRATRISVSGSGRSYRVSVDGGPAYVVRLRHGEAHCECGAIHCIHLASLKACGFVDPVVSAYGSDEAKAA